MKKNAVTRRKMLMASGLLVAGSVSSSLVWGRDSAAVFEVTLRDASRLNDLSGDRLRQQLARSIFINVRGALTQPTPIRLYAVRLGADGTTDSFVSNIWKISEPEPIPFPGDMLIPDTTFFPRGMDAYKEPGEQPFPGDMLYPPTGREGAVLQAARKELARREAKSGWFFVVIAEAADMKSAGSLLTSA